MHPESEPLGLLRHGQRIADLDGGTEIYDHGPTNRYHLDHDEDDAGGLSQIDLPPEEWAEFAISREEFEAAWNACRRTDTGNRRPGRSR